MRRVVAVLVPVVIVVALLTCTERRPFGRELSVTATAYNSLLSQTEGDPTRTAWGDRLEPGMKAVAVSRDLIDLGLGYGAELRIEGLEGRYVVRDKLAPRWRRRIDIYMGNDRDAAVTWGRREVTIYWKPAARSR